MLKILIDADMFVFRACSAVEQEVDWGNICSLFSDPADAKEHFINSLDSALERALRAMKYDGDFETIFCFSDPKANFRKKILPTYKANRAGKRKPVCYYKIVEWVMENYKTYLKPTLEADDCIGILSTLKANKGNVLILSGDKDMKCLPATFYDFIREELSETTEADADYWHLYQTLIGDTTDGYSGCPKVGKVNATRLLDASPTWETVVKAYEKQGLTEDDAIVQARVARILRASDYNFKEGVPKLWTPAK
ncbi:hypothetical protein [Pectinatus frisingensis]|uniref:hypothetical protein n=1 Tax=Pectinatus frisingensis TaxID=865 RepID=UPI0018C66593|nr:hypothetical protein [Pectinatus frisingensis]